LIVSLIKIRFIQLKRFLKNLGSRIFIAIPLLVLFVIIIFIQFGMQPNSYYLSGLFLFLILQLHLKRPDRKFVQLLFNKAYPAFFIDYLMLSFPILTIALFVNNWICCFLILCGIFFISVISISSVQYKTRLAGISRIVPKDNFEWISGLRKNFSFLLPVYFLIIVSACYNGYLGLFFVWLVSLIVSTFYIECEPLNILLIHKGSPVHFLLKKIKTHFVIYSIFTFPVILLILVLNHDKIFPVCLLYTFFLINIPYYVVVKYTLYKPNENNDGLLIPMAAFGVLFPFLLPVPLIMIFRNFNIAKKNIAKHLYAEN
jgi:hypothetical protein